MVKLLSVGQTWSNLVKLGQTCLNSYYLVRVVTPSHDYNHEKFVNESAAEKFGLIFANRSFIKEKGFHHPPRPTATMVVQEFYANLVAYVLKKLRVRGVLVDFSVKSINAYYNLELVNSEPYDRLYVTQNYPEILRMLTNGQGEWKLNNEGHAMHFKAKHLAYIPKVWHNFITSHLIPTKNVLRGDIPRGLSKTNALSQLAGSH